jgi:dethiobiotin synthetase
LNNKLPSLFIIGTDTCVGKTFFTAGLALLLKSLGIKVGVMKPIQTGVDEAAKNTDDDDAYVLSKVNNSTSADINCYSFSESLSPHLAAERRDTDISIEKIKHKFDEIKNDNDVVLVEGAGGILVPIKKSYSFGDLAKELDLPVVIVARATLGTINHTLLTAFAAREMGIKIAGIVVNKYPDKPTLAEKLNPEALENLSGLPMLGILKESDVDILDKNKMLKIFSEMDRKFHTIEKLKFFTGKNSG